MEDGGAAVAVTNTAEKVVAIPVAAVTNGGGKENKVEDLPAPALPSGPRKTGLFIFIMNIRCV